VRSSIFCLATNTFQGNQPSPYSREHCGCSFRYLLFSKPCRRPCLMLHTAVTLYLCKR